MENIQQGTGRQKKQVHQKIIRELQRNKTIRAQALRMCGKTALLLNGTPTALGTERRSCCKNVDSVFLSLDDRKGELYWKTAVAFTIPFEGLVAQRTTRLTTNQEIAGSNPAMLGDCLLLPMFLVFDETGRDYSVDRHQKKIAATKRRIDQSARTFTKLQRLIMKVKPRKMEQGRKRLAKKLSSPNIG